MKINSKVISLLKILRHIFYPERCPYCRKAVHKGEPYCEDCKDTIPDTVYLKYAVGGYITTSAVPYTDNFRDAVKRFKFKSKTQHAPQFAQLMLKSIRRDFKYTDFDYICCVPLHPKKHVERGYNQSELLAKEISKLLDIPYAPVLNKTKNNMPQHTLKAKDRQKNVKGAYAVTEKDLVVGKSFLLIDDIITTGNTLGECAKTLVSAGAKAVHCATFAVAVEKHLEFNKPL